MPIRIVRRAIFLDREVNGKTRRIVPKIGKPFDFLAEEIKHLEEFHPTHIRHPANEMDAMPAALPVGPSETEVEREPRPKYQQPVMTEPTVKATGGQPQGITVDKTADVSDL